MMDYLNRNFAVIFVFLLFIVGVFSAKTIFYVRNIESGKSELSYNNEKLNEIDLDLPKIKYKYLATKDDPSAGNPNAGVHIVEFSDFQCPYCKKAYTVVERIIRDFGENIHFVYRDFPLPSHPRANKAAQAAECANEQKKFWEMHDMLFENQENVEDADFRRYAKIIGLNVNKFGKCLESGRYEKEVEDDFRAGQYVGVRGTPTFFINEKIIRGYAPYEEMKMVIEDELK